MKEGYFKMTFKKLRVPKNKLLKWFFWNVYWKVWNIWKPKMLSKFYWWLFNSCDIIYEKLTGKKIDDE